MKKIIVFVFFLFLLPFFVFSQQTNLDTTILPGIGDIFYVYHIKSGLGNFSDGDSGLSRVWDFPTAQIDTIKPIDTMSFVSPSYQSINCSAANLAQYWRGGSFICLKKDGLGLSQLHAFSKLLLDTSAGPITYYYTRQRPEIRINFHYQQNAFDTFAGYYKWTKNDTNQYNFVGYAKSRIDGFGQLNLGYLTWNNVYRVKRVEMRRDSVIGSSPTVNYIISWYWYTLGHPEYLLKIEKYYRINESIHDTIQLNYFQQTLKKSTSGLAPVKNGSDISAIISNSVILINFHNQNNTGYSYWIYSSSGALFSSGIIHSGENTSKIQVPSISNGIYFLILSNDFSQTSFKLIK